jgi:hypothetical protein
VVKLKDRLGKGCRQAPLVCLLATAEAVQERKRNQTEGGTNHPQDGHKEDHALHGSILVQVASVGHISIRPFKTGTCDPPTDAPYFVFVSSRATKRSPLQTSMAWPSTMRLAFGHGLGVVAANQRLKTCEVSVKANGESPILRHPDLLQGPQFAGQEFGDF